MKLRKNSILTFFWIQLKTTSLHGKKKEILLIPIVKTDYGVTLCHCMDTHTLNDKKTVKLTSGKSSSSKRIFMCISQIFPDNSDRQIQFSTSAIFVKLNHQNIFKDWTVFHQKRQKNQDMIFSFKHFNFLWLLSNSDL